MTFPSLKSEQDGEDAEQRFGPKAETECNFDIERIADIGRTNPFDVMMEMNLHRRYSLFNQ